MIQRRLRQVLRAVLPRRIFNTPWISIPLLLFCALAVATLFRKDNTDNSKHLEHLVRRLDRHTRSYRSGQVPFRPKKAEGESSFRDIDFPDDGTDFEYDEDDEYFDGMTPYNGAYREIFSLTTRNRQYFLLNFAGDGAYNPNIIPHPTKHDMWIMVAQHEQFREKITKSEQIVCSAVFWDGALVCTDHPTVIPVADSIDGIHCTGPLSNANMRKGPRDARMFYSPTTPYLVYNSQSQFTCFGIWLQDARMLLEDFRLDRATSGGFFRSLTEIQRPLPWHVVEKNFFLFWDPQGRTYAHYDLYPKRVFAELDIDGSQKGDLAPTAALADGICMAKYMPPIRSSLESIHQATNSLSITMCKRTDPKCKETDQNTFTMHIFHHKSFYMFHGIYEPYVILFNRTAPFNIVAIAQRPLWIHGRNELSAETKSVRYEMLGHDQIPEGHTEMFYMTSLSWKKHGLKYHGYMDDIIMLAFGIEDTRSAAIDIKAEDLLQDLAFC